MNQPSSGPLRMEGLRTRMARVSTWVPAKATLHALFFLLVTPPPISNGPCLHGLATSSRIPFRGIVRLHYSLEPTRDPLSICYSVFGTFIVFTLSTF